jgi:hypothetical protein
MRFSEVALTLYGNGYEVIPVIGKRPSVSSWQSLEITEDQVKSWASNGKADGNTGIRTGQGAMALYPFDCDIYDKTVAVAVRKAFWEKFGAAPVRIGQAPKSLSVYRGVPGKSKLTSAVWVSPDGNENRVEILGNGQQFVGYGIHPDTGKPYEWKGDSLLDLEAWEIPAIDHDDVAAWLRDELPKFIPSDWVKKGEGSLVASGGDGGYDILDNVKQRLDITDDELRGYVKCFDPECDYDTWIMLGMGIHHQTAGSEDGYAIWAEQSRRSSKHNERETRYKWDRLTDNPMRGKVTTAASIIKLARVTPAFVEMEREKGKAAIDKWGDEINNCDDAALLEEITERVAIDGELSVVGKLTVEGMLINKYKLLGVPMTKSALKQVFRSAQKSGKSVWASTNAGSMVGNEWCIGYVWCQFEDCFIQVSNHEVVSVQSFNAKHGRDVKGRWMNGDYQMKAAEVALHELQIPVVDRRMYLPTAGDKFEMGGMTYLNRFRPSSMPEAVMEADWTDDDRAAVELVKGHITMLCGDSAAYMIWWMAHNIQRPGVKIRHAPLIKGIEGDGKSLLGEIMAFCLGAENVRIISPKVLLTDFNGWAEGHCVGIFEETRIPGHNRHDAANAVKPNITNDTIPIHRKGKDEYNIVNTSNYMALTNYSDALPLTQTDRRWHVIFSPFTNIQELIAKVGIDYFERLFNAIRNHGAAISGWFKVQPLDAFDPNGRAPDSDAKDSMVSASMHEEDELILDIIAAKRAGVSDTVISTKHLTTAILMIEGAVAPRSSALAAALSRLGYCKKKEQVKWKGEPCRIWVKGNKALFENDVVRHHLDKTIGEQNDENSFPEMEIPF